jgi:peptidyl-Asp metalloendopeptidase
MAIVAQAPGPAENVMPTFAGLTLSTIGAIVVALCLVSPALAQTKAGAANADAQNEQVIITKMPAEQSRVRNFLSKLLGKSTGEKLEATGTEVLSVPKERSAWLIKQLERLGCTVVTLSKNWQHILSRPKDPVDLTSAQKEVIDKLTTSPETVNVGVLSMPAASVAEHALTRFEKSVGTKGAKGPPEDRYAKVMLPLSATTEITLVRKRPPVVTAKGITWLGEVEGTGERAMLMLWKDGHLSGYFGYKGRVFVVNHMGNQVHTMAELDPGKLPPDHAPDSKSNPASRDIPAAPARPATPPVEPVIAPFPEAERKALEAKKVTIDVMLLYTGNAGKHYIRDPEDLLELAIETANETFRNSGLGNISLRLVHSQGVDYEEGDADQFDHLYRMVDGIGPFKDLKKLRNEKRADIVGLIIHDPNGCGLSTRVGADADEAFFVVHHSCAAITYSIAHEIGHILGARHDRAVDLNETPFPFGHGYVNGTKWRDMMSYREGCGGCPRIPFWSNPRVMYKGEPTGTAAADNARAILLRAEHVANFR